MAAAPYDLAALFLARWREAVASGRMDRGGLVHARMDGDVLMVSVRYMPPGAFSPRFLADDPAAGGFALRPLGERYWLQLTELAVMASTARGYPVQLLLRLMPDAIEAAIHALRAPVASEAA